MFKVVKIKTQEQRHSEYYTMNKIKVAPFFLFLLQKLNRYLLAGKGVAITMFPVQQKATNF